MTKTSSFFSLAYAWLNYGVALEKLGNKEASAEAYAFSLKRNPGLADAHYNLAILYWNRDWEKVRFELAETVRLNPNHPQAGKYLSQLSGRRP
jgi:tetratricopeptide (TPR) repeat protein